MLNATPDPFLESDMLFPFCNVGVFRAFLVAGVFVRGVVRMCQVNFKGGLWQFDDRFVCVIDFDCKI